MKQHKIWEVYTLIVTTFIKNDIKINDLLNLDFSRTFF